MMLDSALLSQIFILGNLLVAPLYILMMFFPRRDITKRVLHSPWSVSASAFLTVIFGISFVLLDENALSGFFQVMGSAIDNSAFDLYHNILVEMPPSALVVWLHMIAADLVMARWTYLDSQEHQIPTIPSSICIFFIGMNGPLGFVLYLPLRSFYIRQSRSPLSEHRES